MGRGGRRQDEGIVCELRRPGRAEAISLLRDLSKRDSSKARTERGTREPRQSRVLRSQTSPPPLSPHYLHVPRRRGRPRGSPCFLLPPRRRCYTHRLLPRPPAWAPCPPGRPFALLPASLPPSLIPSPEGLPTGAPVPTVSAGPPLLCLSFPSLPA